MKKRVLSLFLAILMIISMIPSFVISSFAAVSGDFKYSVISETEKTAKITEYNGSATDLEIPSIIDGYTITEIVHLNYYDMTSIIIPNTIISFGNYTFSFCEDLQNMYFMGTADDWVRISFGGSFAANPMDYAENEYFNGELVTDVVLSDGITSISDYAFYGCDMTSITIPNSVTSIGENAFCGCDRLQNMYYKGTVDDWTKIKFAYSMYSLSDSNPMNYAKNEYFNGELITDVVLPVGTTNINDCAFSGCNMTSITIPNSVTSIGEDAFYGCDRLQNMYYTGTVDDWAKITFESDWSNPMNYAKNEYFNGELVTDVVLPVGTTNINDYAFTGCGSLQRITIPDSVTLIGYGAFYNTAYYNNESNWENGVLYIDKHLIDSEDTLSGKYVIKAGTKSIASGAFIGRDITNITIPNSVTSIGRYAFNYCSSLTDVCYKGTEEQWNKITIESYNTCLTNATIHFGLESSATTTTKSDNQTIKITPRNGTELLSGEVTFADVSGEYNTRLNGVKITTSSGVYEIEKSYDALKSSLVTSGTVLTHDNYYDYIIPKKVIESWSTNNGKAFEFEAFMQKNKKDGKPYVSTVFARESEYDAYKDMVVDSITIIEDESISGDAIVTAGGLNGKSATYYISQDDTNKISNNTGRFTLEEIYNNTNSYRDVYAYCITSDGVVTDPVKINIEKSVPLDENTKELLYGTELSLVGEDGQKISLGDNVPLIGGAEISLDAFDFPIGVDVSGDTVKISLGLDIFESESENGGKRENEWLDFKKGINGLGDNFEDSKDALNHYRNFAKTFIDKHGLKQVGFEDKSNSFNVSFLGYLEGKIINGKLVFSEALIKVEGNFTFKYTQQTAVWIVPVYVYVEAGAGVTLTSNWARQFPDKNIPIDFGFMLDIEPSLKLGGGIGVNEAISAGLWGKGTLPYSNDFSEKYHELSLKGEIGWEAEAFVLKASGTLLEGELQVFEKYYGENAELNSVNANQFNSNQSAVTNVETSVAPRDYADDMSEWLGEYPISLYSLADNGLSFNVLQASIFEQSNPQIVTIGDKSIMAWVQDDTSRDEYNRMRLVYSVYDSALGTWSEPKAVCDDGKNDAYPSLATDGDNVFVTWQKINKNITSADITDATAFLQNSEIFVAKYDAENDCFIDATQLTNNAVYDYAPTVIVDNGNAVVHYVSSGNNNFLNSTNNAIYRQEIGKNAEAVVENQSYVVALTSDIVNGKETVSYSVDTDGNTATSNDITVYTYCEGENIAFDKGENNIAYMFADYSMFNESETLFVSDMNNIYYEENGEVKTIFTYPRAIDGNINLVETNNGLSVLWTEKNETGGNDVWTVSYEDNAWTEPVQISDVGSNLLSQIDVAMIGGKLVGVCNFNELTYNSETESYTKGAANLCTFTAVDFTDISLDVYTIDESEMISGETTEINVFVTNNGTTSVDNVEFTIIDTLGTEVTIQKDVNVKSGCTESVALEYLVPTDYSATTLTVSASIPKVEESDLEDNTASVEIGKCDLSITQTSLVNFGDNYVLKATVENNSSIDASGITISSIFNDSTNTAYDVCAVESLAKTEYVDYELIFNKSLVEFDENGFGKVYVKVGSASEESNTGDNEICVPVVLPNETTCGHPLTETVEAKEPTCTEEGQISTVCQACGEALESESVSALGHEYSTEYIIDVEPTCTTDGSKSQHCSRCDDITNILPVPARGHEYSTDYTVDVEPTLSSAGSKSRHCKRCDAKTDVTEIEKLYINSKDFTGLYEIPLGILLYVKNGEFNDTYKGLCEHSGNLYYVEEGMVNKSFTGLCKYNNNWYYVEDGIVDNTFTGLVKYSGKWYHVKDGVKTTYTGLVKHSDGKYYYVKSGVKTSFNGLVKYNGKWYYVKSGVVDKSYTGLVKHTDGKYYYVKSGVKTSFNGLVKYNSKWYYVKSGVVDKSYTGLVKHTDGKWYYVKSGVKTSFNGLVKYNGKWYYVKSGVVNTSYTGLVKHTDGKWYYVKKGVKTTYTGNVKYNGKTYKVVKGVKV